MSDEMLYTIAFTMLPGLNDVQRKNIFEWYGSVLIIYKERDKKNFTFSQLTTLQKNSLMAAWPLKEAAAEINFIQKNNIQCISIKDPRYPHRLLHCPDAPVVIYVKGTDAFNLPFLLSVVGSRQHTVQVYRVLKELMEGLSHLQLGIISGMALGVDGLAHQTALENKIPTWGVLAHGLDQIYPLEHRKLASEIIQNGGLITESRKESIVLPYCFPKRNRIVAGMSDATLVIETALKGGSMITANLAFDYNREVFAVPGKIHDSKSKGCLALIKKNKAHLYYDVQTFLEDMSWPMKENKTDNEATAFNCSNDTKRVLEHIQLNGPIHREELANQLKINVGSLSSILFELEIKAQIQLLAGNRFVRL
jgi:DNA processing protein